MRTSQTCVKPGGDSSLFFNCGSGRSPRFSHYQWRLTRVGKDMPMAEFLIKRGRIRH